MRTLEGFKHGVNLGGWLSQCDHTKNRYDTFITEEDIRIIKSWGLDHVRVPVDYNLVEEADGTYKQDGFAYISKAVLWTKKEGLNMVLDLHKTYGYSFDSGEKEIGFFDDPDCQERFMRLWEEFARRFGKEKNLIFELLNEVTDKAYSDKWNEISTETIKRIRNIAPDIGIIVGGYYNNSIEALKDLAEPFDENVIYTFHCYEPLIFTHQGAPWIQGMNTEFRMSIDCSYGDLIEKSADIIFGSEADVPQSLKGFGKDQKLATEFFEKLMDEAVRVAEERNVRLYCGEYGVIDRADPHDALKWYKLITECMDSHNIGRAAWTYKAMDFGISDAHMDQVRNEILKLL